MPQHSLCSIRLLINSKYRVSFLAPLASRWCTPACQVAQSCLTLCHPVGCSRQAPLSMGFSRQEHWSVLPCSPLGDLPDPGIEPTFLVAPASRQILSWWTTEEACMIYTPTELTSRLPYFKSKSQTSSNFSHKYFSTYLFSKIRTHKDSHDTNTNPTQNQQ